MESAARWLLRIAGVYGLVVLIPLYFMETEIGRQQPPPITHPEYFYGFIGTALAFQLVFLVMSRDPIRFRCFLPAAMVEKFTFGIAVLVLATQSRIPTGPLIGGLIDLVFGIGFVLCYFRLPDKQVPS